jgi:hypothetical protein
MVVHSDRSGKHEGPFMQKYTTRMHRQETGQIVKMILCEDLDFYAKEKSPPYGLDSLDISRISDGIQMMD